MDGCEKFPSSARTKTPEPKSPRHSITFSSTASGPSKKDIVARDLGCGGFMGSRSGSPNLSDMIAAEQSSIREAERCRANEEFKSGASYPGFRERVCLGSQILVEIRTNKKVDNPIDTISKLVEELKVLFDGRPVTVTLDDEVKISCQFGDEPAYIVFVTALCDLLTPRRSYRYASIIQQEIHAAMHIPPTHGIVRLLPAYEHHFGTGGTTYYQKVIDLENASKENSRVASRKASTSKKSTSSVARLLKRSTSRFSFTSQVSWKGDKQRESKKDIDSDGGSVGKQKVREPDIKEYSAF
ncbi:TPA_exp: MIF domain protein [Trichophyton benhamiae CBS 112371]|nr:TPA_exp: MIF domain protein [Trichophyton benhamiae CBS 112371]